MYYKEGGYTIQATIEEICEKEMVKRDKEIFEDMKARGDIKEAAFIAHPNMKNTIHGLFNSLGYTFPVMFSESVDEGKIYIPNNEKTYNNLIDMLDLRKGIV